MRIARALLRIIACALALAVVALAVLTVLEYRPAPVESVPFSEGARRAQVERGQKLTLSSFHIGSATAGRDADGYAEGGKAVLAESREVAEGNLSGIASALANLNADILLLQAVDKSATRSHSIDEAARLARELGMGAAYATDDRCAWAPYPWPMPGAIESGLMTLSNRAVTSAERVALPASFPWPLRTVSPKRCLLVERLPVAGTDAKLVLINLCLDSYASAEARVAQARAALSLMQDEYRKGNYVIAGGDFACAFPNAQTYTASPAWQPAQLRDDDLPPGFRYVNDSSSPTRRLLDKPYTGNRADTSLYVTDGFILSDNLQTNHVETVDLNFRHSAHNPVRLIVTLK